MMNWLILFFIIAMANFSYGFISNNKKKKKVVLTLTNEKNNLDRIVASSDSKLLAIKRIKSSFKLDTLSAIEVYLNVVKKSK